MLAWILEAFKMKLFKGEENLLRLMTLATLRNRLSGSGGRPGSLTIGPQRHQLHASCAA